jgi:glutaminyl-tRNA synthetase
MEDSLTNAAVGSRWQLERVGYFAVDEDSRDGALVLNRIVTLRGLYPETKVEPANDATKPSDKAVNAKAKTRPKGKSPVEYRAEARARDPELAAAHDKALALVTAESADLLTGDLATARLFLAVVQLAKPEMAAKWIINELPRALGESSKGVEQVAATELGALLAAVDDGALPTSSAKAILIELVRTGKPFAELRAEAAAPIADLGASIETVIAANPDKVSQYKAGKTGLLGFFVGQVMKAAPGADAAVVNKVLRERLT